MSAPTETTAVEPTKEQLQFARAVYIILMLWPALRQAVNEHWGGPESEEKREFLLSHLCDEYGNGGKATKPDLDDITDLIEGYVMEEYDCELEDNSAAMVAQHVCLLHAGIFEEERGDELLKQLEASFSRASGHKVAATTQEHIEDIDAPANYDYSQDERPMEPVSAAPRAPAPKPKPEIDEDGFETVQPRRRR
ncbi:rRNA accumulation-related protein [Malassezia pachydermatis]|uniref:Pre-rrna-processing protein tsr2 n=1 Tax=Malassezia pachydermatis TaxID=77020 RepID=A0A0N0RSG6_9BASI|nr:hypothetical protein Malapachy_0958 [Malassezia pachydermatis]KOS14953.1 hypothetical protein Malapachy_0958 [Malassezia pachydermatis]